MLDEHERGHFESELLARNRACVRSAFVGVQIPRTFVAAVATR
jgi:hypothetical protein